jgi:hypothetical protein
MESASEPLFDPSMMAHFAKRFSNAVQSRMLTLLSDITNIYSFLLFVTEFFLLSH